MRIYIIGFMGSGKSSYGKKLAKKLGFHFLDLDAQIEKQSGKTISQLFGEGEDLFRKTESETLRETSKLENTVISTGGGAPCFHQSMDWMLENGQVIYFKLFDNVFYNRLIKAKTERPLIKDMDEYELRSFIREQLNFRSMDYCRAHYIINPELFVPEMLAEKLLQTS